MLPDLDQPYRAAFDELLAEEGLDRLDQFLTVESFDEAPLYSRLYQLDFLAGLAPAEQNRLLVRAATVHLVKIVDHARRRCAGGDDGHLRMVSVTNWCDYVDGEWFCSDGTTGLIRPNFWIGNLGNAAMAGFVMHRPETAASRFVAGALDDDDDYVLTEGRSDQPGAPPLRRVYVRIRNGTDS
jgi:hypothetical protein